LAGRHRCCCLHRRRGLPRPWQPARAFRVACRLLGWKRVAADCGSEKGAAPALRRAGKAPPTPAHEGQAGGRKEAMEAARRAGTAAYSASMPAALITWPHFWVSAVWNWASSAGVLVQASEPALSKKLLAAALL